MLIFYQLLPLSPLASRRRYCCWNIIVVVGVSDLDPCRQSCRRRRLVVVKFSSFLAVVSLIMSASVGICASSSAASRRCRQRQRHPNRN